MGKRKTQIRPLTMKNTLLILVTLLLCHFLPGCVNDYEVDSSLAKNYRRQPVVNCIFSTKVINLELEWNKRYDEDSKDTEYIEDATIQITDDHGELLYSKSPFQTGRTYKNPEPGHTYHLWVSIPEYGELTASTYLPYPAYFEAEFIKYVSEYQHLAVTEILPVEIVRAFWIRIGYFYEDNYSESNREDFYTDSPVPDNFNSYINNTDAVLRESNIAYERFIRLPFSNSYLLEPLYFSVYLPKGRFAYIDEDEDGEELEIGYYEYRALEQLILRLITPSDDYDKYMRSTYKQMSMGDNGDFASINDNMSVYSNISNGLGIFAGFTEFTKEQYYK